MAYVPYGVYVVPAEVHGLDEAERFLKTLGTTTKTLLSNTLNELAINVEKKSISLITGELNLSAPFVKSKFTIEKSDARTLIAKVRAKKRGLLLSHFEAEQLWSTKKGKRLRSGVRVKVKRSKKTMKKAFLIKGKNGKQLVAIRQGKGRNNFKVLYGPSASQAFDTFSPPLEKTAYDDFDTVFGQELAQLL